MTSENDKKFKKIKEMFKFWTDIPEDSLTDFHRYSDCKWLIQRVSLLEDEKKKLREILNESLDVIHGEFCSSCCNPIHNNLAKALEEVPE